MQKAVYRTYQFKSILYSITYTIAIMYYLVKAADRMLAAQYEPILMFYI